MNITFEEGDAEKLPYSDESFNVVVSMFGAMFAPRPELVASELLRVTTPGGTLAMANWTKESFVGYVQDNCYLCPTAKYNAIPPTLER